MKTTLRLGFLLLWLAPFFATAEGSKQLTPNTPGTSTVLTNASNTRSGYLAHDANFAAAAGVSVSSLSFLKPSGFSYNGATYNKEHRMYVRVLAGEQLHYGVHRTTHDQGSGNHGDLIISVKYRRPDGTEVTVGSTTLNRNQSSTRHMLLIDGQAGVIRDAAQVLAGPVYKAGTNGYTSLSVTNPSNSGETRDYFFEFTQTGEANMSEGQRFSVYDFWDFSVYDANKEEKPGRLHSKLWAFSAGGTSNVFSSTFNMFPLIPSEDQAGKFFVKKLELAGIAPQNFFRFVTNRFGSDNSVGSSEEARRKSQNAQKDYPEFNNFVNNPDPALWPSATAPTFSVSVAPSCNTNTGGGKATFNTTSSERSTFIVLVNLNGVAGYQPGTADVLLEQVGPKGSKTLEWNGLDGQGNQVAKGASVTYFFKNAASPVHFPVWDAEMNVGGFRVEDVRPVAGSNYNGELYWDDSNLSTTAFPAPQTELFGVSSTNGAHSWGNTSTNTLAGDLKLVNTWTYGFTNVSQQTHPFSYDCIADVGVTQTVTAGPYTTTKPLTYTLTVTNHGPVAATGVTVTDLLDATKLQFISSSDDAAYNSSTGLWTIGALAVNASQTLTITAQPKVLGSIVTTATKASNEADNNTANNSAAVNINVVASADIEVRNTVPQTIYNNGDLVPYTITARNLGPNAATGVSVTDLLPAGLTLEGTAPAGYNATTGVWTVGELALNQTKTLVLNTRVSKLGPITTTASLNSRDGHQLDENRNNNVSSNTITVNPTADVAVNSTVSSGTTNQNETVTFTITATNNGPNNATNVVLTNPIPAGLAIVGSSATAGTINQTNYTWSVGTIPVGTTQTLTLQAKAINVGTFGITSSQSHTENDGVPGNDAKTSQVSVGATADVAVTNTVSAKDMYATGDAVTYTIVVTNNGPSAATNVVVTDKLPSSLTLTDSRPSVGSYNSATGAWTVGTLASGASAILTLDATINQSAIITTTATQTHTEFDNVNGNNSASNSIKSGSGTITADIKVEVSASAATAYTGQEITFTTKATNTGPDAATSLSLNALVPAGMTLVSATPKIGTYNAATGKWDLVRLASGAFTELILVVKPNVDNTVSGDKPYTFTANGLSLAESQGANTNPDQASVNVNVKKSADAKASITVTGDVNGVFYRNLTEATFTFTVTNDGPDVITNLIGTDTRTGTIDFTAVPVAAAGTSYSTADGLWRIPTLNPGESKTLTIKGIPNTVGRVNLGGQKVSQDQFDPNTSNDKAVALLNVVPVAELAVTNTVAAGPYYTDQPTTFTVKVTNNGPDAATGVKIVDVLPAGLTFISSSATVGSYDASTGLWTLGTALLAGSENAQTLVLTVKPTSTAVYNTTASVHSANEHDSNNTNNSQQASVQAAASADIAVVSVLQAGPYFLGESYTVTVTAKNEGPDAATGVVLRNELSNGLQLVENTIVAEPGTSFDPATGIWTIGNIGLDQTRTLIFKVMPTASGTQLNTTFKTGANEFDTDGGNTANGNNIASVSLSTTDRPATVQQPVASKHYLAFAPGEVIAKFTDPDGLIENATIVRGTLPTGVELLPNGELHVQDKHLLKPGRYTLSIETVDATGGKTTNEVDYTVTQDWDNDGVIDSEDIDDNNDGITDIISGNGVDPLGDADSDGDLNYHDRDFVHPVYGAYRDQNNDGINDVFDMDLDRRINSLDADIDGDGITNVLEANRGKVPEGSIYNPNSGTITGPVSTNGMPVAAQTGPDNGVSVFAQSDSDGDTFKDFLDIDSDNDGILDNIEAQPTIGFVSKAQVDTDRDGINDAYDPSNGGKAITPVDTDGDGKPDYLDLDSDEDLTPDFEEAFDDDQDGTSLFDMMSRGANFETENNKGYYTTVDANKNKVPDWLDKSGNSLAYLTYGNAYYYDTDMDGLVDLLDTDSGGRQAALQTNAQNEYAFRNTETVTPLPVLLIKFAAKAGKQGVEITWATASEQGNSHFDVERSTDGRNFAVIGTVKGAGTSSISLHYSLLDAKAPAGTVYYRLKQVDEDGTFTFSGVVSVTLANVVRGQATKAVLYPNPTTGLASLNMSSLPVGTYSISVISVDGRTVQHMQLNSELTQRIDVSNLAPGKYILRIQGEGVAQSISFIKN